MAILFFVLILFFVTPLSAQSVKPLYQLPEVSSVAQEETGQLIVGSDKGLFRVTLSNNAIPLWTEGRVDQILHIDSRINSGTEAWYFRTSKGIFYSTDLRNFQERNSGLPFLTVKKYDGEKAYTEKQIHSIKDMSINPANPKEIVVATKDDVYFSKDGGITWKNLRSMSLLTPGIKACAVATIEEQTVVFMSHPLLGFSYIFPDEPKAKWNDVDTGFESMKSLTTPDEISDIYVVSTLGKKGEVVSDIYISQTYLPRIYKFNWEEKSAELVYTGEQILDVFDGLTTINDTLLFTKIEGFGAINLSTYESPGSPVAVDDWHKAFSAVEGMVNSAWIPAPRSGFSKGVLLNELWLLYPGTINTSYGSVANEKKSIYASAYQCRNQEGLNKFKKIVKDNNLNSVVIDMKDDYGLLRYNSKDSRILEKAKTSMYAINLDKFVSEFKKDDIYLIARIVAFKDRNLASYDGAKYAIWDKANKKPWIGIKEYEKTDGGKKAVYYDENWIDPYCHEVWEYNVQIANELISRGFDEIQFDYIRFPTDGINLKNASYRWQNEGMDKESALISFLAYARANIDAPIGIDIYGANGWYRSGTRTGQDAETLCEYADIICPMFYPSHFEQTFLNYEPVADRTYRIYYYGTFRNTVISRNRAIIRPWVQAFYLNVSYDRLYYDTDYVQKQIFGVRDSVNRGYMYWNNSGDYSKILPDVTWRNKFTGTAPESSMKYRKPAIGTVVRPPYVDAGISVLNSVLHQDEQIDGEIVYTPFLQIPALFDFGRKK